MSCTPRICEKANSVSLVFTNMNGMMAGNTLMCDGVDNGIASKVKCHVLNEMGKNCHYNHHLHMS